jgi:serralysin
MAVILGTRRNDTLAALADGDAVFGQQGDDSLSSAFNQTALYGGAGNDLLMTDLTIVAPPTPSEGTVHGMAIQDGGTGDDTLNINMNLKGFDVTSETSAQGGSGDDQISIVASPNGDMFAVLGDDLVTNTADGGDGNDHIIVFGETGFLAFHGTITNALAGGCGNDVLDATAILQSIVSDLASNSLDGGAGNDVLRAFCSTDSDTRAPVGINELSGGNGNDTLEAIQVTDGENFVTDVTNDLVGGNGNDNLVAATTALARHQVTAHNNLDGGTGNDSLIVEMLAGRPEVGFSFGFDVSNVLNGGNGDDYLEAAIEVKPSLLGEELVPVQNHLSGGSGEDVLVATIADGTNGSSFLDGGTDNDQLTVVGGSGNILDGGDGQDRLAGGVGIDQFIGGSGADTFCFDITVNQGVDTILDFESDRDIFRFSGLIDQGDPGLIDDLNAISTVTDLGMGSDVTVEFASGSRLVLSGVGTGDIDNWNEIVSRPSTQILASDHLL